MRLILAAVCFAVVGCGAPDQPAPATPVTPAPAPAGPFASDVAFLRQHTEVVALTDPSGSAQVVVAPAYQGRVMTSTTGGSNAPPYLDSKVRLHGGVEVVRPRGRTACFAEGYAGQGRQKARPRAL